MFRIALILLLTISFIIPSVKADRRKYVWTYQFATMPMEGTELEFYQTVKSDERDSWEYRIEIEHGITPRFDIAVYQIFSQQESESFKWDAFQIRGRYKLAAPGRFPLNPLLYVEYNRKIELGRQNKLETKLILGRNFDRINLAINPVWEFFWAPGEPNHELGVDVGISYEFSYKFSLGAELTSRNEFIRGGDDEQTAYLGPTASYAPGRMFYTVGVTWGITDESDDTRIRFIMGIDL